MRHGAIRFRTDEPDFSEYPEQDFDWAHTVYGELTELLPKDAPEPLGKFITMLHFVDTNLMHDIWLQATLSQVAFT